MNDAEATSLAQRQADFFRAILDENAPLPPGWGNSQAAGMAVYRGNYRSAVMGALASTYERVASYVGEKAFRQASINHVIANPPSGWTIDDVGRGFDLTCASYFKDNPEVAELAWLEWAMLELATAPDCEPLDAEAFAAESADFGDEDWGELRLAFQPRANSRIVGHDLIAMWQALSDGAQERPQLRLGTDKGCIAWREGDRPTFLLFEADETRAFQAMQKGAAYGEIISILLGEDAEPDAEAIQQAAMRAGGLLGQWLQEGLITAINP